MRPTNRRGAVGRMDQLINLATCGGFMPGALGQRCVMPLVGVFISRCMSRQGSGATGFDDK